VIAHAEGYLRAWCLQSPSTAFFGPWDLYVLDCDAGLPLMTEVPHKADVEPGGVSGCLGCCGMEEGDFGI
jgi:hypothetical protein